MTDYFIIRADLERHSQDIIALRNRNLEGGLEKIFPWKYQLTPYGPARTWLAAVDDGDKYVGAATIFPRRFCLRGRMVDAWVTGDFSVDQEHRGFGPALKLQQAILSEVAGDRKSAWLYGWPNKSAAAIFHRLGYRCVGTYTRYLKVLKSAYVFRRRGIPSLKSCPPVDLVLKHLSGERAPKIPPGVEPEAPEVFDGRFDTLWDRVCREHAVLGERTAMFLDWRFFKSSSRGYRIFSLARGNDLLGYLVYHVSDGSCFVADALSLDGHFESMLAEFIRQARKEGLETIEIFFAGSQKVRGSLRRLGFLRRKDFLEVVVRLNSSLFPDQEGMLKDDWHFMEADKD